MTGEQWADAICAQLGGMGGLAAEWSSCIKALDLDLGPLAVKRPAEWSQRDEQALDELRGAYRDVDGMREAVRNTDRAELAHTFTAWRQYVHAVEGTNAAKLATLLWMLRTASRVSAESPEMSADVAAFEARVAALLEHEWSTRIDELPSYDASRQWCTQRARSYDALPKFWRYV